MYAAGFRVSQLKGCEPFWTPRGSGIQISHKTFKKGLKNIQKSIAAFSINTAANRTARDIPGKFLTFLGCQNSTGQCPLCPPPDKNSHEPGNKCIPGMSFEAVKGFIVNISIFLLFSFLRVNSPCTHSSVADPEGA